MDKNPKVARQIRGECGISSNQLRALINKLSMKELEVSTIQQSELEKHSEMLSNEWRQLVDERHSDQMHCYILFALKEKYTDTQHPKQNEDAPILLPFSRQKVYMSRHLAFEFIVLNKKLTSYINSMMNSIQVLTDLELKRFLDDYMKYLWSSSSVLPHCSQELLSLTTIENETIFHCWRDATIDGWNYLIDSAKTSARSAVDILFLLCRLCINETLRGRHNFPILQLIDQFYNPVSMSFLGNQGNGDKGSSVDLALVWNRLTTLASASDWKQELKISATSLDSETMAKRDSFLASILTNGPFMEGAKMKELHDGVERYLLETYSDEAAVLEVHLTVVTRKLSEDTEDSKEFVRWLILNVDPSKLLKIKAVMDGLLSKIVTVITPSLFRYIVENWPTGDLRKLLLRRAFTALSLEDKVHYMTTSSEFSYPNGNSGWNKDLMRCLNRASSNEVPAIVEELHLLVLYNAKGVLDAIVDSAINKKGSFEIMITLLDAISFTFTLPHRVSESKTDTNICLLSSVLRPILKRALDGHLSDAQQTGWRLLCQRLCSLEGVRRHSSHLLMRLLNELVISSVESRLSVAAVLQLGLAIVVALKDFSVTDASHCDALFSLFVFAVCRASNGNVSSTDAQEAIELVEVMQIEALLPILARPSLLSFLKSGQPVRLQLLCRPVLRTMGEVVDLSGARLGTSVNPEALATVGCRCETACESDDVCHGAEALANFLYLASSSGSGAEVLLSATWTQWTGPDADLEPVRTLTSALLQTAPRLPRHAWPRLPAAIDALLRLVKLQVACRLLSKRAVAPLHLSEYADSISMFQIFYVACEMLLLAPSCASVAVSCIETTHSLFVDAARRCSGKSHMSAGLRFFCVEAIEWTKLMIDLCPDTMAQAEGFRLVVRELESILRSDE